MPLSKNYRDDFPIFEAHPNLIYLDSAATSQKPNQVIEAIANFYRTQNGSTHNGIHALADKSVQLYEQARQTVADFIGANPDEIIWTQGTTAALNTLSYAFLNATLNQGKPRGFEDLSARSLEKNGLSTSVYNTPELANSNLVTPASFVIKPHHKIIFSAAEHHANIVPWQELAYKTGAKTDYLPLDESGRIDEEKALAKIDQNTRIVALTHISNVTGCITPLKKIVKKAKSVGAFVVLDACQSAAHMSLDVTELDVDFLAFSAHKFYGPTGVGVLWGRQNILEQLPPVFTGGYMIQEVQLDRSTWDNSPTRFEPGTQMIGSIVGLAEAVKFLQNVGLENIHAHSSNLLRHMMEMLDIDGVKTLGPSYKSDNLCQGEIPDDKIGLFSFTVDGIHPHDVGTFFAQNDIAIRVGHSCAQPIHRHFNAQSSCRISGGVYNSVDDVEKAIDCLKRCIKFFRR